MAKRILVGVAMVLVVVGAMAVRFWQTAMFDVLVLALSLGCAYEVVNQHIKNHKRILMTPVLLFPLAVFVSYYFAESVAWALLYQVAALLVFLVGCVIYEIILPKTKSGKAEIEKNPEIYENGHLLEGTVRSMCYCIYPTMLLGALYGINALGTNLGLIALLLVFGVSAMSDTLAFFFGVWLKGARLCPEISPKKGVPGMIFGFVGGIIAAGIIFAVFRFTNLLPSAINDMKLANCIAMFSLAGVLGSLFTQVGDLFESAIKRNLGIKDFGNIFPGHGGLMDRVDGQMFNAMFVLILFLLFI